MARKKSAEVGAAEGAYKEVGPLLGEVPRPAEHIVEGVEGIQQQVDMGYSQAEPVAGWEAEQGVGDTVAAGVAGVVAAGAAIVSRSRSLRREHYALAGGEEEAEGQTIAGCSQQQVLERVVVCLERPSNYSLAELAGVVEGLVAMGAAGE